MSDVSLPEYPEATQRRLRESGDWTEAQELFNDVRQRCYNKFRKVRGSGSLTIEERVEANKAAWDAVYAKWPPPETAAPLRSLAEHLECNKRVGKTKSLPRLTQADEDRFDAIGEYDDLIVEVRWVYNNLEKTDLNLQECPSRGAYFMLKHARRDKGWFFAKMWPQAARLESTIKAAKADESYKPSKAEKLAVAELDEMIREATVSVSAQSE